MVYNYNAEIEQILNELDIPHAYMFYEGAEDTYITYMQESKDSALAGDDKVIGAVIYYDVDIYSKGNYLSIIDELIPLFEAAGWTYQPSRESPDFYEKDTKMYHKTICFAKETI
jgi:hypothetical protein